MAFQAPRIHGHNELDYQELLKQVQTLQGKLSAKTDALLRLGKDVEEAQAARDSWKARAETYERNLERSEQQLLHVTNKLKHTTMKELESSKARIQALEAENGQLKRLVDDLKAEIRDLQKDCKTFRQQLARAEVERVEENAGIVKLEASPAARNSVRLSSEQTSDGETIGRQEKLVSENRQLEADMASVLSTKEELVLERDALVKKVERLSQELTYLLNGDPKRVVEDLDSLMAENRYLKAQLDSAQEERQTIKENLEKYKSVAEHVAARRQAELGSTSKDEGEKPTVAVVNMKQIRELLSSHSIDLDESDYRALSNVLLDLCNDKQMALAHQRRANKILGNRLYEVEQRLQGLEAGKSPRSVSPRLDVIQK